MASTVDQVMQEINALSPHERLHLVNRIVETLLPDVVQQSKKIAKFPALRGKYRDIMRSSDEFSRHKEEEIHLENRSV